MASRKEYELLFQLNAQMGSSYNNTFKSAQGAVASLQNEITALSKTQSDISAYQKQQAAVEASKAKLEMLQKQYDNIQKEISETEEYSSALENKLLSKQLQIEKTTGSIEAQTAKLEYMSKALREAGINTDNLAEESERLGSEIDRLKEKQEAATEEASNYGTTAAAAFGAVGQALVAAGIATALHEIYEEYTEFIAASMAFESAMTGVEKTTELTEQELAVMAKEIKTLSTDIPIVTEELAGIGEVAGQLGIAKDNLLDFSTVMSMLSTATTMTAEEGATMLAQFANITRMDPSYYSNLASAIVDLGNNYATTEQKITEMSQGIAASASLAGMSEADMLALSAAVTSLGIETQAGSTSMSKLISELMTAVETGEKLTEFASIANMTADEFKAAWGENAVAALQAFVVGLNDTERNGKSAIVALTELGITEARMQRMVLSLANSGDLLNRTLATANEAWAENTALIIEAEKRYATTQSQQIMMQNAYNNLRIAIGDDFTPTLRKLYALETELLKDMTEFVEKNPELVKAVAAFTAVMATAVTAITAYVAIAKIAAIVSAALTAAIPGINVIMAVVAGVALLSAGIAAIAEASKSARDETWKLTAVSRDQYNQLQDLNAEYEKAVEVYGETSYEAQELKWQIEDLNAEYESGMQTTEEYRAAHEDLMRSYREMSDGHAKTADELYKEEQGSIALIAKLKELATTTESAAANKQAILSIIKALNEQVPDLALNYDQVANSSEGFIDSLYDLAKAQAEQMKMEVQWAEYVERVGQHESLLNAKKAAEINAKLAQEENEAAKQALKEALVSWGWFFKTISATSDYQDVRDQLDAYNKAVEETTAAYEENAARIAELEDALQSYQGTGESIQDVIRNVRERISELSAAYEEAYNDALESLAGQYALWDKAKEVATTSASEINSALESQTTYWQNYNDNLSNLIERSGQIEGLAELISTFADGSEGSVNAIAGMARATDDELATMVANWKALQEEQKKVAGSLADLETEFTASMDLLELELATAIEKMDMSEEAALSGKETMQGFIDGAEYKLPAVKAAYERIAKEAIAAMDAQLQIKSPSKVFELRGQYTMGGFIGGITSMETEMAATMKEAAKIGAQAFTAEETQVAATAPFYMGHYSEVEYGGRELKRLPLQIQAYATGTTDAENIFLAGEYGPELVIGAQGSTVFPAGETRKIIEAVSEYRLQYVQTERLREQEATIINVNIPELAAIDSPEEAKNKLLEVQTVYARIAKEAIEVIDEQMAATMKEAAIVGSQAFNAEEAFYSGPLNNELLYADYGGGSGGSNIIINLSPVYNISGMSNASDIESVLSDANDDLKAYILEVIEDAGIDTARRSYK